MARYLMSCFLLLLPILAFNVLLAGALPAAFQRDVFWRDIPPAIALLENALRMVVLLLPALMPLELRTPVQRTGLGLFLGGALVYFASWGALILAPGSAWSSSALGFTAPAWTPALWLAGLTLLGERLFEPASWYRRWMYGLAAAAFVAVHVTHAGLVFTRLG